MKNWKIAVSLSFIGASGALMQTAMISPSFILGPLEKGAPMPDPHFSRSADQLKQIAKDVLDYAVKRGASAAETEVSEGTGQTVTVRQGEVETIEYNRDKGSASPSISASSAGMPAPPDFSPQAVRDTVDAALSPSALHRGR